MTKRNERKSSDLIGFGENLSDKQEKAIVALLTQRTHEAAARKAGISAGTLRRWLQQPDFRRAYRAAREQAMELSIARIQQTTGEAVDALRRSLTSGAANVEVRAAVAILDNAFRGAELLDLADRVAELERMNGASNGPWSPTRKAGA